MNALKHRFYAMPKVGPWFLTHGRLFMAVVWSITTLITIPLAIKAYVDYHNAQVKSEAAQVRQHATCVRSQQVGPSFVQAVTIIDLLAADPFVQQRIGPQFKELTGDPIHAPFGDKQREYYKVTIPKTCP